jgi:hypothetical protein
MRYVTWTGHVALLREIRNGNKVLVRKSEEKRGESHSESRHKCEDNTKMEHNKKVWNRYMA